MLTSRLVQNLLDSLVHGGDEELRRCDDGRCRTCVRCLALEVVERRPDLDALNTTFADRRDPERLRSDEEAEEKKRKQEESETAVWAELGVPDFKPLDSKSFTRTPPEKETTPVPETLSPEAAGVLGAAAGVLAAALTGGRVRGNPAGDATLRLLSKLTCYRCGGTARHTTRGWYCDACGRTW